MCGIVAIYSHTPVNQQLYDALISMQHRGQDAAGMLTCAGDRLTLHKSNGLVRDVFHKSDMFNLTGSLGLAHIRYPTAGTSSRAEAQPFYVNSPFGIGLAHNGNLTNSTSLRKEVFRADKRHINTSSDSEVLINILAVELAKINSYHLSSADIFNAVEELYKRCIGGYAAVSLLVGHGIIGFRDPHGIRPLVYGKRETKAGIDYIIASESVALDMLGFELISDVAPGEIIYVDMNGNLHKYQTTLNKEHRPCIFEYVYLSRPDSVFEDVSIYKSRLYMGEKLANKIQREFPDHDIDVVIPIPDTSRTAAITLAYHLGIKCREGLIKNPYIGRTFIMPGQKLRRESVRQKLNAVNEEFKNKNVLLVDDSIVRGTTSKEIIQMARDSGAKKVYIASAAPPVRYPNVYGIDMPSQEELIAHNRTETEIAQYLGADRLFYQDIEDLKAAISIKNPNISDFETSIFDGQYVTGDVNIDYLNDLHRLRNDSAKSILEQSHEVGVEAQNLL